MATFSRNRVERGVVIASLPMFGAGSRCAAPWRRLSVPIRSGACGIDSASSLQCRGLFSFVKEADQERDDLVARSREALRELGKHDDYVALHLPFSPTPSGSDSSLPIRSTRLPPGLETLKKTALLEIHNPSARNALSGKMMAQLADIVSVLEDPIVHGKLNAVVLRGTGGWFCAGADLRVARQELNSREAGAAMGALMVDTLTRFRRLPLVSVAVIEGGAFGGGAELATACDFRVMEQDAVIQFVQSRMGVVPGWGGGARLYKIVGRQNALRLLCTAEKLSPERALELALVDEVFNATNEKASNTAIGDFLAPFDVIAPAVSHGAKRVINNADDVSLDEVLEYEHGVFKTLWGGPANLEALRQSLTKKNNCQHIRGTGSLFFGHRRMLLCFKFLCRALFLHRHGVVCHFQQK